MRYFFILPLFFLISITNAQVEKPPIYPGCEDLPIENIEDCFYSNIKTNVLKNFSVPQNVINDNYKGRIKVVFLVNKTGDIEILYVNSMYKELEDETKRVFANLPTITPGMYNGRAVDNRYAIPIDIPIIPYSIDPITDISATENFAMESKIDTVSIEDAIADNNSLFQEFSSELNIPFTHQAYDDIIYHLNQGENTHTNVKPYLYNEVEPYIDLEEKREALLKDKKTWGGRKLFNEHLFLVKEKDFWFTVDPTFDFQIGKDNSDVDYTYNNTRAIQIQGGLGKKFSFFTAFYESQGRFANYVNEYARSLKTNDGNTVVVPGRGKSKIFKTDGFDYPVAEAYLSYTPNKFFNFQFGNGKNFIGDGYRSMFLSDVSSPYPFFKINTQFWKIKYTNLWMWMDDVRPGITTDESNLKKYVAMHHLSWNVTDWFNLGFFEAVITNENSNNGFDISFFNPIIFYRAVEFSNGSESGNAQVGLDMKFKVNKNISIYNQFLIDEMTMSEVFSGEGYWGNKFAFQLGSKYYNAFKVDNLMLQAEFNWVRPYTYSHEDTTLNSGHYNQPTSHLWGGNLWEFVGIARYSKDRWFGSAKLNLGEKGFDFSDSDVSYGGNIYISYDERVSDYGNEVAQGNTTKIFVGDIQAGYILNPATNLHIFGGFTYRSFSPLITDNNLSSDQTTWFTIGLKSNLFNSYFDY